MCSVIHQQCKFIHFGYKLRLYIIPSPVLLERKVSSGRRKELWDALKVPSLETKVFLTIIGTQPEKSLSSLCVASEVDTENLRNALSQRSGYVVLLFAPRWPKQEEQKT